jgi:hypothetical protein
MRCCFRCGSLLDTGRIARVFGGLGQLLHAGLGIIEGDNRFACLEGTSTLLTPSTLEIAFLTVIGQAEQVMPGTDSVTVWVAAHRGATTAAMARGTVFHDVNSCG